MNAARRIMEPAGKVRQIRLTDAEEAALERVAGALGFVHGASGRPHWTAIVRALARGCVEAVAMGRDVERRPARTVPAVTRGCPAESDDDQFQLK